MLKGNYKAIGVAVLAAVILFALLSRCTGGGGGKESKFLNQIQGYWTIESLIQSDGSTSLFRPREISITKNAIQLGSKTTPCPMSEAEYKDGALYFTAQWYESFSFHGQEPGIQNFPLRLVYDKSSDLLTLEVEADAGAWTWGDYVFEYSAGWYPMSDYARMD